MFEIGRVCVKIAGRDAGKKCVIVETVDDYHVVIDGETRRRKVNIKHIDPTAETLDLGKADHASVVAAFDKLGLKARSTKPKQSKPRAKQIRAADRKAAAPKKEVPKKESKESKPAPKKESKPEVKKSGVDAPVEE